MHAYILAYDLIYIFYVSKGRNESNTRKIIFEEFAGLCYCHNENKEEEIHPLNVHRTFNQSVVNFSLIELFQFKVSQIIYRTAVFNSNASNKAPIYSNVVLSTHYHNHTSLLALDAITVSSILFDFIRTYFHSNIDAINTSDLSIVKHCRTDESISASRSN